MLLRVAVVPSFSLLYGIPLNEYARRYLSILLPRVFGLFQWIAIMNCAGLKIFVSFGCT